MVRIMEYGDIPGVNTLDLVIQLKRTFPAIKVCFGQFICSSHSKSYEKGKTQYSKLSHPVLQQDLNGLEWMTLSKQKLPTV